jgi:hypothetical protein
MVKLYRCASEILDCNADFVNCLPAKCRSPNSPMEDAGAGSTGRRVIPAGQDDSHVVRVRHLGIFPSRRCWLARVQPSTQPDLTNHADDRIYRNLTDLVVPIFQKSVLFT